MTRPRATRSPRMRAADALRLLSGVLVLIVPTITALPVHAETASRIVWQGRWGFNDQSPAANYVTGSRLDAFNFIQSRMEQSMRVSYGRCGPPTFTFEGEPDRTYGSGLLYYGWPSWRIDYIDGSGCFYTNQAGTSGELFSYAQPFDPGPVEERSCRVANPVLPGTGRKLHDETDYSGAGADALDLRRYYRSRWMDGQAARGVAPIAAWDGGWKLSFHASLTLRADGSLRAYRPDGTTVGFGPRGVASAWTTATSRDTVTPIVDAGGQVTGFTYQRAGDDSTETYDATGRLQSLRARNGWLTSLVYSNASTPAAVAPAAGLLISVRNAFGRELRFTYDAAGRMAEALPPGAVSGAPAGATSPIRYRYDEAASLGATVPALGQLTSVTWQDGAVRRYHYEDGRWPQALTGITDEASVRYATYAYDGEGRVVRSEHAGGADRVDLSYGVDAGGNPVTTVTDYSGPGGSATSRNYGFVDIEGVRHVAAVSAPCSLCGNTRQASSYDSAGRLLKAIDHDGTVTFYAYDAKGNETERATFPSGYQAATTRPALSAATKVVSTKWHGTFNLPTQVAEPGKITSTTYNSKGMATGESWTATTDATGRNKFSAVKTGSTYATGWGYNTNSLATSIVTRETPLGSTTATETGRWSFVYAATGDVNRVTDVTGAQSAAISANAQGRMTLVSADNGAQALFAWTPRGLLEAATLPSYTLTVTMNVRGLPRQYDFSSGARVVVEYGIDGQPSTVGNGIDAPQTVATEEAGLLPSTKNFVLASRSAGALRPEWRAKSDGGAALWRAIQAAVAQLDLPISGAHAQVPPPPPISPAIAQGLARITTGSLAAQSATTAKSYTLDATPCCGAESSGLYPLNSALPPGFVVTVLLLQTMASEAARTISDEILIFKSARKLRTNLCNAGVVALPGCHHAHHIVAVADVRAQPARAKLAAVGIDINDAFNGMYVPCDRHGRLHTDLYYSRVNEQLAAANTKPAALLILSGIRLGIQAGSFP